MTSPEDRREAVRRVQEVVGVSERRACQVLDQPRSTQRYEARRGLLDAELCDKIQTLSKDYPHYGYRRIHALLRRGGVKVNIKRVHRLWKQLGLQIKRKTAVKKKTGAGHSDNSCFKRCATGVNDVWTYDFIETYTTEGRKVRILAILDEYTRECLAIIADRSLRSHDVLETLRNLFMERGAPRAVRSDNGSEFAAELVRKALEEAGAEALFVAPGAPWENGYIESFNSRFRAECLDCEDFCSILEVRVVTEAWRRVYNEERPHSSLDYMTPREFATAMQTLQAAA